MTAPSLEDLRQQLAVLQSKQAMPVPSTAPQPGLPNFVTEADVKKLVADTVDEKLRVLREEQSAIRQVTAILESHLETDEKVWLSHPGVCQALPNFLASADGHELVRLFITDFKDYYEDQTRSGTGGGGAK